MAKLAPLKIEETSSTGETKTFSIPLTVGASGIFRAVVPMELEGTVTNLKPAHRQGVAIDRSPKNDMILAGSRLEEVRKTLEIALHELMVAEIKTERVIIYDFQSAMLYYRGIDGEIHPNALYDTARVENSIGGPASRWGGGLNTGFDRQVDTYTIGIYARVMDKVSHIRPSGTKVTYASINGAEEEYHEKLNAFTRFTVPSERRGKLREIPYTEEAAKFFYETIVGLCKVADRLEKFFASPDQVILAIADKTNNALLLK